MPFPLSLTGLSSGMPIPGTYIEVQFAAGTAGGDLSAKKVLLLASSLAAGTIVQDTEIYGPISGVDEAELKGGSGSPLHRMARAFFAVNKTAQVYLCAPTRSAGTQATFSITIATNATGAGVAKILFCEESLEYAFLSGDTPTIIAAGLVAAFNAKTALPATAANAAGVVTLTAKVPGPEGNALLAVAAITSGVATTVTNTTESAFAGGATSASYTNALVTLAAQDFDLIVPGTHAGAGADTALSALVAQINVQALPVTGIRQKVIAGVALAPSTAVTLAQSINKPRLDIVNYRGSSIEPCVVAAVAAAVQANTYFGDPSINLAGYGKGANDIFPLARPRVAANAFTTTEQTLLLNGGVTPIAVTATGTPYIVREVTTYSLNGATPDYRVRDSHRVMVADWFADTLAARLATAPWKKICEDPPNDVQPPSNFGTPKRVKGLVEQLVSDAVDFGYVDPAKKLQTMSELAVGIDPIVPTRMNIRCPVYSANLFLQSASLIAESSSAS